MREKTQRRILDDQSVRELLARELVGRMATIDEKGFPYVVPMNFVYEHDRIYIHSGAAGEKFTNMMANPQVGFEIDHMYSLLHGDQPCKTNLHYESVIIRGRVSAVADMPEKLAVLNAFVAKYTPQHMGKEFTDAMLKATTVLAIDITACTGKRNETT